MDKKGRPHEKAWQKPELIMLVRSKPEEAVLTTCKVRGAAVGPSITNTKCNLNPRTCLNRCYQQGGT